MEIEKQWSLDLMETLMHLLKEQWKIISIIHLLAINYPTILTINLKQRHNSCYGYSERIKSKMINNLYDKSATD